VIRTNQRDGSTKIKSKGHKKIEGLPVTPLFMSSIYSYKLSLKNKTSIFILFTIHSILLFIHTGISSAKHTFRTLRVNTRTYVGVRILHIYHFNQLSTIVKNRRKSFSPIFLIIRFHRLQYYLCHFLLLKRHKLVQERL
jgi:hypothetical protein